jgi:hypothetical protein
MTWISGWHTTPPTVPTGNSITYGTTIPSAPGIKWDHHLITSSGTSSTPVTEAYVFDGGSWVKMSTSSNEVLTQVWAFTGAVPTGVDLWFDTLNKRFYYRDSTNQWAIWNPWKLDMVAQITPTAISGTVINSQDLTRVTNGALTPASASREWVIYEITGLVWAITPTSWPFAGVGELNNGDFILEEIIGWLPVYRKIDNTDPKVLKPVRVTTNLTAGNNTIVHNLWLVSPFHVNVSGRTSTWRTIDMIVAHSGQAANQVIIESPIALTNVVIDFIPISYT